MNNCDDGYYNCKSTLEEGVDVKPFDIQHVDQMLECYEQQENIVITSFSGPAESRYISMINLVF